MCEDVLADTQTGIVPVQIKPLLTLTLELPVCPLLRQRLRGRITEIKCLWLQEYLNVLQSLVDRDRTGALQELLTSFTQKDSHDFSAQPVQKVIHNLCFPLTISARLVQLVSPTFYANSSSLFGFEQTGTAA